MQNASHGVSKTHRAAGSIGMCEFPGKIFKGKKMAGHMGNQSSTSLNQMIVKVDTDRALLYVRGNVPGPISGVVRIRDAVKKIDRQGWDLLCPTFVKDGNAEGKEAEKLQTYDGGAVDPFEEDYHDNDIVSGPQGDDD